MKRKFLFPLTAIFLTLFLFSCQPPANDSLQNHPVTPPGVTDPENPGDTGPENPGDTGPENPGDTGPEDPGDTDPENPGDTSPEDPGDTDPEDPPDDIDPPDDPPDITNPDPSKGELTYSLSFPEQVTTASISVTSNSGSPVAGPFNVLNNKTGTLELAPGSWTVKLNLSLKWGNANALSAQKEDTVTITAGQIISRTYTFTYDDFPLILSANASSGSAYSLLPPVYGYESPDKSEAGKHMGTPHIVQQYDSILQKNVFAFVMHRDVDGNDTGDQTRQRLEIKVDSNDYRGMEGRAFTYRWKFKLPSDFAASTEFTHIHQIKNEGGDDSNPIISLTARNNNGNRRMQLIYRAPGSNSPSRYLHNVNYSLNDFLGEWVQAEESVTYSADTAIAAYSITITRIRDSKVLMTYTHSPSAYAAAGETNPGQWPFVTWRTGNTYGRPKYGLYRLILKDGNPVAGMKDETILYADFELIRRK